MYKLYSSSCETLPLECPQNRCDDHPKARRHSPGEVLEAMAEIGRIDSPIRCWPLRKIGLLFALRCCRYQNLKSYLRMKAIWTD